MSYRVLAHSSKQLASGMPTWHLVRLIASRGAPIIARAVLFGASSWLVRQQIRCCWFELFSNQTPFTQQPGFPVRRSGVGLLVAVLLFRHETLPQVTQRAIWGLIALLPNARFLPL
jgi:hypothetical protein